MIADCTTGDASDKAKCTTCNTGFYVDGVDSTCSKYRSVYSTVSSQPYKYFTDKLITTITIICFQRAVLPTAINVILQMLRNARLQNVPAAMSTKMITQNALV